MVVMSRASCTSLIRLSATIKEWCGEPSCVTGNMQMVLGLELEMMDALGEAVSLSSDDG
jgi:hypothetical protein